MRRQEGRAGGFSTAPMASFAFQILLLGILLRSTRTGQAALHTVERARTNFPANPATGKKGSSRTRGQKGRAGDLIIP